MSKLGVLDVGLRWLHVVDAELLDFVLLVENDGRDYPPLVARRGFSGSPLLNQGDAGGGKGQGHEWRERCTVQ